MAKIGVVTQGFVFRSLKFFTKMPAAGFIALKQTVQQNDRREVVAIGDGDECPFGIGGAFWVAPPEYYRWLLNTDTTVDECVLVSSGILTAPGVLPSDYKIGRRNTLPITDPPSFCTNAANSGVSLSLVTNQQAFVQVPIIDEDIE